MYIYILISYMYICIFISYMYKCEYMYIHIYVYIYAYVSIRILTYMHVQMLEQHGPENGLVKSTHLFRV